MCAHFQNQPFFNALFAKAPGAAFEEPPADTAVHVEDPLGVNVDFAPHTAMDEVFINYPSKPAASLEGDDAAIGLDGYLAHANRPKPDDDIGYMAGVPAQPRARRGRRRAESYPFPEDFRHYKYLPVGAGGAVARRW